MEKTRIYMIDYLLSFCRTWDERNEQEERLEALTDEALREEFTAEYTALEGNCPKVTILPAPQTREEKAASAENDKVA